MSWQSITTIKTQQWLAGIPRKLRVAALAFAGLVCLNFILYGFLVAPSLARLRAGEARYGELRQRHAEAVLFKKQKPSFTGIMAGVPSQKDMPLLVKDLVQTARRLKLGVASVKYDMTKRAGGELAMVAFSFPAEGRYPEIKRFIYDVETADRLVGIQDLKLETDQGQVKLDLKLVTYIKGNEIR
jgi:Tfp pilus assembly protein PilO